MRCLKLPIFVTLYLQNDFLLLGVLFCDLNKLFPADFIIASITSFKSVGVQEEENMKFI